MVGGMLDWTGVGEEGGMVCGVEGNRDDRRRDCLDWL